ncbi:hypothetical protein Pcinc_033814, partial [Petrolisthes cinctipes]
MVKNTMKSGVIVKKIHHGVYDGLVVPVRHYHDDFMDRYCSCIQ